MFQRLVAFPESRSVLRLHLLAAPLWELRWALAAMIPVLLRKHFAAGEWTVAIATSAVAMMSALSILWNELYRRLCPRRYLLLLWLTAALPLGLVAACHSPHAVLACVLLGAMGTAGMGPLNADILRSCYPPKARNRVFSLCYAAGQLTVMVAAYGLGRWLDLDAESFRIYLPVGALVMGAGLVLQGRITRQRLFQERQRPVQDRSLAASLAGAYRRMNQTLRGDRRFRRYETAFFTYGMGWMICYALLPFFVVDVLGLDYSEVAAATQSAFQFTLLLMTIPMSHLLDRAGPIRLSAAAFALLVIYPLGLLATGSVGMLTLVTVVYGIGMAGVNLAWTLGPVSLSPSAGEAPTYLAIHATLVGLRAIIAQFPAVALYKWTGSVQLPLLAAGVCFATGSLLMYRLARDTHVKPPPEPPLPLPPQHTRAA